MSNAEQWKAHCKFVREVVLPAAVKAALKKPMTDEERKTIEEYQRIFSEPVERA